MTHSYRKEIVDLGDRASALAKEVCFQSHDNCPAVRVIPHQPHNFRGPVGFAWKDHILKKMLEQTMLQEVENDGAGGKPQFFTLVGTPEVFYNLGQEIIAMTADDFARSGRFPAVIDNEINIKRITDQNFHLFEAMMEGYGAALAEARLVNITGETAVMKHSVAAFCDTGADDQLVLTWGASCIGLAHEDLLIDSSRIEPDLPIVGFWEPGYRCNGGTFFTNLLLEKFGDVDGIMRNPKAMEFVKKLTIPSRSYAQTVCRIIGWQPDGSIGKPLAKIAGIAHVTGGGIWKKFKGILPAGVGAELAAMPKPAPVLLEAQKMSWETDLRLTDYQAHGTFHGGCGMLIVAQRPIDARAIIREARQDGIRCQIVGRTNESAAREVTIYSRFKERKILSSERPDSCP